MEMPDLQMLIATMWWPNQRYRLLLIIQTASSIGSKTVFLSLMRNFLVLACLLVCYLTYMQHMYHVASFRTGKWVMLA